MLQCRTVKVNDVNISRAMKHTTQSITSKVKNLLTMIILSALLSATSSFRYHHEVRKIVRPATTKLFSSSSEQLLQTISSDSPCYEWEQTIKKSRFIGITKNCISWDDAQDFIAQINKDHPKSRHVCFGFVSSNPQTERCSDDGEPTGTAGVPILG